MSSQGIAHRVVAQQRCDSSCQITLSESVGDTQLTVEDSHVERFAQRRVVLDSIPQNWVEPVVGRTLGPSIGWIDDFR